MSFSYLCLRICAIHFTILFFLRQQQLKTEQTSDEHKAALNPDALRNDSGCSNAHYWGLFQESPGATLLARGTLPI
ncbi:hypothetical protein FKM82_017108 [Ascaphus truei]